MVTIKNVEIHRNWGKRPNDNAVYCGMAWGVEKGEPYDLVQFSINELGKSYFWNTALCLPCGTSEEEIRASVEEYAKGITDEEIQDYRGFLEDGERWGWD